MTVERINRISETVIGKFNKYFGCDLIFVGFLFDEIFLPERILVAVSGVCDGYRSGLVLTLH